MSLYKKNNFLKKFLLVFFVFGFFSVAKFALALEVELPEIFGVNIGGGTLPEFARYFFNIGIFISITLAGIVISYGGIYFLIDYARGKFSSEGKGWLKAGIAGLLLTTCAYLIAYTINPYLVVFSLEGLAPLDFITNFINTPQEPGLKTIVYNEIPIGTLTENLISRPIDCYAFDEFGDPIDGDKIITDEKKEIVGPTYLEHDRVDCFSELSKAAEKKADAVEKLSDEIIKLMQKCSCGLNTSSGSNSSAKDIFLALLSLNSSSKDSLCANKTCSHEIDEETNNTTDCTANCAEQSCSDKCSDNSCKCSGSSCDQCPAGVKDKIDHGKISLSGCKNKDYAGLDEFKSEYNNSYESIKQFVEIQPSPKVNDKKISVIKKDKWDKLRLIDQIIYLRGKIEDIKKGVETDLKDLVRGEEELGKCYLADSYVDFVKTFESNNDTNIVIKQTYTDQQTEKLINPAKYCKGYEYDNSACYSQCKDICPGDQEKDFNCYKKISDCSGEMSATEKEACSKNQKSQYLNCFNSRSCIQNASPFSTFGECLQNCKQNCLKDCDTKFCTEGAEKTACQKNCNDDSQCLINNFDSCLVNIQKLRDCVNKNNNLESWQKCWENAGKCTYCSDQYAGYADCLESPYSLQKNYSSSYIFQNRNNDNILKCTSPNKPIVSKNGTVSTCVNLFPETTKCPANSKCPDCPCNAAELLYGEPQNAQACSGNCDTKFFNDDPLTFYCNQTWWTKQDAKKETPVGEERICPIKREVPVGQTVDESEVWAQTFIDKIGEISGKIKDLTDYMEKIGKEKKYCECESTCGDSGKEPICKDICVFHATEGEEGGYNCYCQREGCKGNPCQKIINMLKGKKASEGCPQGVEYKGIKYYHTEIKNILKNLLDFISSRSDILKKLEYSRSMTDACSTTQNNYGDYVQLLSCTRAEDEIIYPIVDKNANGTILNGSVTPAYCYGKELGKISGKSVLMDNWFCCEIREKDNTK